MPYETTDTRDCDLCIVGAGYAGLNALNAAAAYLPRGARVVVIDRNATWGGQWLHQYDFLRLHQPYRMFTAGDQPWTLDRPPEHLATRREVLDHLQSVPRVSAGHLAVEPLFGCSYEGHTIRDARVEIDAVPRDGRPKIRVRAARLLKGTGVDIQITPPFRVSSNRVRSVGIADPVLGTPELIESDAPVYVIGSGKSAMDLVLHLARSPRRRRITVITGSGMWFFCRDARYPTGLRRYVTGSLTGDVFLQVAMQFDGSNERRVMEVLEREGVVLRVFGDASNLRYGMLSLHERAEILAGVSETLPGHLVDVEGTRMTIRTPSGALREVAIEPGAWLVSCTSHLRPLPHEPVLQDGGLVAAPQFGLGFTGTTAWYLTHLWYRGELAAVADRLYRVRVDVEPKLRFGCELAVMVMANLAMVGARLPMSIPARFLGDFNKWYPLHRQLPVIARILASRGACLRKAERLLPLRFSDPPDPR